MALSPRERTALEQDVRRLEGEIKDKEAILAHYQREPSLKRYIPGLTNEITGLKSSSQSFKDILRRN